MNNKSQQSSLRHIRKTFTLQQGQSDCGVACLSSIIKYHGGYMNLEMLRIVSGTRNTGTTLLGLHQAAKKLHFESEGLQATVVADLKTLSDPAILHILKNNLLHYVVFYGFEGDRLIIGDPQLGVELWTSEELDKVWQSRSLLAMKPGHEFEKSEKPDRYLWIKKWITEDTNILVSVLFLGIILSVFNLSSAVFIQKMIDNILPAKNWAKLVTGLSLFSVLLFCKAFGNYIRGKFIIQQSNDFNVRMFDYFFEILLRLPKSFFDSRKAGEMVARMNDTRRIQLTVSNFASNLVLEVLVTTISIAALFFYHWVIGTVVLSSLLFFFLLHKKYHTPIVNGQKKAMGMYGLSESNYIDTISGISEIKSTGRYTVFSGLAKRYYSLFQQQVFHLGIIRVQFGAVGEMLISMLIIAVVGTASYLYFQNSIELGVIFACFSLSTTVGTSAASITLFNLQIQEAKIAFERMDEYTSIATEGDAGVAPDFSGVDTLSLRDVTFHYPGTSSLLSKISLQVQKGVLTALLGESGEGKSTIIQLLQRFYVPAIGQLQIGNFDAERVSLDHFRKAIAVVSQETKIFNNHLLFNITLCEDESEFQKAFQWCERLGFGGYFRKLPQGYLTLLGEEGVNISGGQKQLVALARALYRNPHFLLIDEGTSAMDKNTESFVMSLLRSSTANMGILFVTHRIKTASKADNIYILKGGKIDQCGSPDVLMRSSNLFSDDMKEMAQLTY